MGPEAGIVEGRPFVLSGRIWSCVLGVGWTIELELDLLVEDLVQVDLVGRSVEILVYLAAYRGVVARGV